MGVVNALTPCSSCAPQKSIHPCKQAARTRILHSGEKVEKLLQETGTLGGIWGQPQENFKRHEKAREAFIYQRSRAFKVVLKRGLEPLSLSAYAPQAYVSTNFTT